MRDAWVRMKDGKTYRGPIWMWRPKEGWFSLIDGEDEKGSERILFDDVLFGHLPDDLSRGSFLARAIDEGWEPKISSEPLKIVFEEMIKNRCVSSEDSGCALIYEFSNDDESGVWAKVTSWDESKKHIDFNKLLGRKVRVTIETLD